MDSAKAFVNFATSKKDQDMLEKLNRRSVCKDIVPADTMMAFDKINIIYDDMALVNKKKRLAEQV